MPAKRISLSTGAPPAEAPAAKRKRAAPELPPFQDFIIAKMRPQMAKVGANIGSGDDAELALLHLPVGYIRTGIYGLDSLLSAGKGIPLGRFIEVFAPESVGKSALCEFLMGRFKARGGTLHHIDTEHARDDTHLASYDVFPSDYIDCADIPDLEAVWDYVRGVVSGLEDRNAQRTKLGMEPEPPNLVLLDSAAATPSRAELKEKSHNDSHVGLQARANSKGVRTTLRAFSASAACFLIINQIRDKIGMTGYGPKTETPGGRALKFAYSIRLKLAKIKTLKRGETAIGHIIEVHSIKNKMATPQMKTRIVLSYARGIDANWSNFMYFQEHGLIVPKGKKGYSWKGEDADDTFTRQTFGDWVKTHKDVIKAAVKSCRQQDADAVQDVSGVNEDGDAPDDSGDSDA